jgi:hypothetical protein
MIRMAASTPVVIPAKPGIQAPSLSPRFRGDDDSGGT